MGNRISRHEPTPEAELNTNGAPETKTKTNGMPNIKPEPVSKLEFTLKDEPVENLRPLKVICVGAGYSGILAAIRIPERLRNVELVVYEKNEGIGGVWWLNRYPGLACDVPSHSYQYTFAPNPHWSDLYAPGAEIQAYLQGVAEKYGATRFIKTSHCVEKTEWNEKARRWNVTVKNLTTGEVFEDESDVVLLARGQLNNESWPEIKDLDKFQGKVMHSASWDESSDLTSKNIGIIGNGSSAIQIIPALQKLPGTQLTCFMRSPTWIAAPFGDNAMKQLGLDPSITSFSASQRANLASDPQEYFRIRKVLESDGNLIHESTLPDTDMQRAFAEEFRENMTRKLAGKPELVSALVPSFAPGCRRVTPGRGFLEALVQENVEVVHKQRIVGATATGILVEAESWTREIPLDVLICATGFRVSEAPPFPVLGRQAQSLSSRWRPWPESYLSMAVDDFPNLFLLFGPNSAIGFGSLTKILEAEVDYAVCCIRKLQKEDYITMAPKKERVRDFQEYVGKYFEKTVYMQDCKSWYKADGGTGRWICGLWPGSTLHALEALRAPRWEDWEFESVEGDEGNRLRWLGNGWSVTQKEGEGDPSWYLNPDEVMVPTEGKPEENKRYRARPWSY